MEVRVGLIGPHSAGKTTLVEEFSKRFPWVVAVKSASRDCAEAGFKLNREADMLDQIMVTVSRINKEESAVEESPGLLVISDRTPLDSLAYSAYQTMRWGNSEKTKYFLRISADITRRHMKKYDRILFIKSLGGVSDDGVRDIDLDYQRSVEALMESMLEKYDHLVVPAASIEDRLGMMTSYIFDQTRKSVV